MKINVLAGSLRQGSINKKLAQEITRLLQDAGHETKFLDLKEFNIPVYDGDVEDAGMPEGVTRLDQIIKSSPALVVVTPEYNGSIPGVLKNAVDWLSRVKPHSLKGRHLLIMAASPGALGGVRSLWHTRVPFEVLGAHVYPDMLAHPKGDQVLDESGRHIDPKVKERTVNLLKDFTEFVARK